jgi:hypothetical protein
MMSIRIPDEDHEWLEDESQRRGVSKAEVINELIRTARRKPAWGRLEKYCGDLHGLPKDLSTRRAFEGRKP